MKEEHTLDDIKLSIPPLWQAIEEWSTLEEDVLAAERPAVQLQIQLGHLLRRVEHRHPDPAVIAWLILWTRTFQGLEGVRGAIQRRSLFTCRILERTLFETSLHLLIICRPFGNASLNLPDKLAGEAVRSRLTKYCAWCIWNDCEEWRQLIHPRNLRALYDPRPAREYMAEHATMTELWGSIAPKFETLTDAEAEQERSEAARIGRQRLELYERWLCDPRLSDAAKQLESARTHDGHMPGSSGSFFKLLDESEASVAQVLKSEGIRHGYAIYASGSGAIHGSSLAATLWCDLPAMAPQIGASDTDLAQRVEAAVGLAGSCTQFLMLLRSVAMPAE